MSFDEDRQRRRDRMRRKKDDRLKKFENQRPSDIEKDEHRNRPRKKRWDIDDLESDEFYED